MRSVKRQNIKSCHRFPWDVTANKHLPKTIQVHFGSQMTRGSYCSALMAIKLDSSDMLSKLKFTARVLRFLKIGPIPGTFCLFLFFSHHNFNTN